MHEVYLSEVFRMLAQSAEQLLLVNAYAVKLCPGARRDIYIKVIILRAQ